MPLVVLAIATSAVVADVPQTTAPAAVLSTPVAGVTPAPTPAGATSPTAGATSPSAGASPAALASAEASGAPVTYNYRFVPFPPADPDAPRVFAVYLNDKVLHAPGPIDIRIDTSPDVIRVEEHTGKKSYAIPMTAPGRFISNAALPKVPFIAHGIEVKLDFVAYGAAGKSTDVSVPFTIR